MSLSSAMREEERESMPQLSTPPWRTNRTPRRHVSRSRPRANASDAAHKSPEPFATMPSGAQCRGATSADQSGAAMLPYGGGYQSQCGLPVGAASESYQCQGAAIWHPADFPSLTGVAMSARPKTPGRHTPKGPSRCASHASFGNWADATAATASPTSILHDDQAARKKSAPIRAMSMPPDRGCNNSANANWRAGKPASGFEEPKSFTEECVAIAEKVHLSGFLDPVPIESFMKRFSDAVRSAREMRPVCSNGVADEDPAALFALHLIAAVMSKNEGQSHAKPLSPIVEGTGCRNTSTTPTCVSALDIDASEAAWAAACQALPTPSRNRVRFSDNSRPRQPSAPPCVAAEAPAWFQGRVATPSVAPFLEPVKDMNSCVGNTNFLSGHARNASMKVLIAPRRSKYCVVNPRTGERLVVSSVVPFSWRQARRLRIVDPKTGEEVWPLGKLPKQRELQKMDKNLISGQSPTSLNCANGRLSIGSVASSACRSERSETPGTRRGRRSIVGGTVKEGSNWALEPAAGGYWDWPLSRQEKKDRVLLLGQLQMATEIEELQAQVDGRDGHE